MPELGGDFYREQLLEAGCYEEGHFILNSGRHTDVKVDAEKLILPKNSMRRRAIMSGIAELTSRHQTEGFVPVPNGALNLVMADRTTELPTVLVSEKIERREFEFGHPTIAYRLGKSVSLAIFDDVITTGGTPLAMANAVHEINPRAELGLVAIWRRDELLPEVGEAFSWQEYLVEENVPSWPADQCQQCP